MQSASRSLCPFVLALLLVSLGGAETRWGTAEAQSTPPPDPCAAFPEFCVDTDTDGVPDSTDNCDTTPNPDQKDSNQNGDGDVCDDADDDGVLNVSDNCPEAANGSQQDLDSDGSGDACDPDRDNDGLADTDEGNAGTNPLVPDSDGDTICDGPGWGFGAGASRCVAPADNCPLDKNAMQLDRDEDGIGDPCDAAPDQAFGGVDSDGDGVIDAADNCPAIPNAAQIDTDGDGAGDPCDPDDDNDGVEDWVESGMQRVFVEGTGHPLHPQLPDSDGDGLCDGRGPGPNNSCGSAPDNCPTVFNPDQFDSDADGIGNVCEDQSGLGDADHDSISDAKDNCPTIRNSDQRNTDGDAFRYDAAAGAPRGGGNACDDDDDADGMTDWDEGRNPRLHPWEPDSDHYGGGGYDDFCDGSGKGFGNTAATVCKPGDNCAVRFNPGQEDTDGNGIGDSCDLEGIGDLDKDGVPDGIDNCVAVTNSDQADADQDGPGDDCDADDDNDGIADALDNCIVTPNPDQFDTDGDIVGDACDLLNLVVAPGEEPLPLLQIRGGAGTDAGRCSLIATRDSRLPPAAVGECLLLLLSAALLALRRGRFIGVSTPRFASLSSHGPRRSKYNNE